MSISNSEAVAPVNYSTLIEALDDAPGERPFATMWEGEDDVETVTFGAFRRWSEAQAAVFHACGVQPGDRVVLIMRQSLALMAAFAGAMRLGAVPAILAYPNVKIDAAKYRVGLAGVSANLKARLIVLDPSFPEEMRSFVTLTEGVEVIHAAETRTLDRLSALPSYVARKDDLAFIQHSAGTTGLQKGVALTHVSVLRQLAHLGAMLRIEAQDRIYSWLPLYHDMGLIACFMLPLAWHLPLVMQSPTQWVMQPRTMLEVISQHRATLAWIPNFAFQFLARRVSLDDCEGLDLSCLRALTNCSEPVRASSMDEFTAAFAPYGLRPEVPQASYALAENVFAVTQTGTPEHPVPNRIWVDGARFQEEHIAVPTSPQAPRAQGFTSSGSCLPGSRLRIVDDADRELPEGHVGELSIQGDSLFAGYYNRPDLTNQALRDGWYSTADLAFVLDGELYVVGRKRDLIIVAGKNIYPQDVEEIIYGHPAIHDGRAVALGVFNPELGTDDIIAVAEVVREEDLAEADAIESHLRNAVTAELGVALRRLYLKPPRWIVKSTAGKPARSTTLEKLAREHPELGLGPAGGKNS